MSEGWDTVSMAESYTILTLARTLAVHSRRSLGGEENTSMQLRKPHWILALVTAAGLIAADSDAAKVMMEAARKKEVVDGDLNGAIREYSAIVAKYKNDRPAVAMALVHMAEC